MTGTHRTSNIKENAVGEWWDSTTNGASSPNCNNVTDAYQGGFIKSSCAEDDGEQKEVSLKFVNTSSNLLVLCWVSDTGELHHFYRIRPHKNHIETSTKGQAFVISLLKIKNSEEKNEVDEHTIVAAYRVTADTASSHVILIKSFPWKGKNNKKWKLCPFIDSQEKLYESKTVGPWKLQCEPGCWEEEDDDNIFKNQFQLDLMAATDRLPKHALKKLSETVTIWINKSWLQGRVNDPTLEDGACFHEDREWLKKNFHSTEKKFGIEWYSTDAYLEDFHLWGPGGQILHELSHAWHRLHVPFGYNNKDIIKCYKSAMKEKLYECVQYHTMEGVNDETQAYACENEAEYFAELSVAFLSDGCNNARDEQKRDKDEKEEAGDELEYNKWFPFTRKQLAQHDPRAYDCLNRMWGAGFSLSVVAATATTSESVSSSSADAGVKTLGDRWDSTFSSSPDYNNVTAAFVAGLIRSLGGEEDDHSDADNDDDEEEEEEEESAEEEHEEMDEEEDGEGNEIEVRFLNKTSYTLILCWVSPSGDLEHYYRIPPSDTHLECTRAGDAFVISVLEESKDKKKKNPVVNEHNIVAAYRPMNDKEEDHFVVIKAFPREGGEKKRRYIRGGNNLVEKMKWKLVVR